MDILSGDSNLICGGNFGRISVYSQVRTIQRWNFFVVKIRVW